MTRVRIFGGGVSGLTVAHELACREGFEVIVHEPRADLGGKARTADVTAALIDAIHGENS